MFEIVDRYLGRVSFQAHDRTWIECYLHEDSLNSHRFTVVERDGTGKVEILSYHDEAEAREMYREIELRTRAAIVAYILK